MIEDAAVAVIAGGMGTRLGGVNKALVELDGRPILAHQLDVFRWLFREIVIVANDPKPFEHLGFPVVPDRIGAKGAPGGVHAAILGAKSPWVFCVACDMPFVREEAILLLAGQRADFDAVAPIREGRPEPLFAFYSKACAGPFAEALLEGDPSFRELFRKVKTRLVEESALAEVDPGLRSLENVNTPEDLARAMKTRR